MPTKVGTWLLSRYGVQQLVLQIVRTASLIRVFRPGLATAQGLQASMAVSFVIKARMPRVIPVTMAGAVEEFLFLRIDKG